MDLKWLQDLLALEQERSFSRAAALRHVTQPQLSRRIQALEAWAGAPLVQRGAGMLLTTAGQALAQAARTSTQALDEARARIRNDDADTAGEWLCVATGKTLARTSVPGWVAHTRSALRGRDAQFRLRLQTGPLEQMGQALLQGRADLLLCFAHPNLPSALDERGFESLSLGHDALLAVSAPATNGKPLYPVPGTARKPTPVLHYAPSLAMWHVLQAAWHADARQLHLRSLGECDFAEAIHEQVLLGQCAAWLPRSLVQRDLDQRRLVVADQEASPILFEQRLMRRRGDDRPLLTAVWRASSQYAVKLA